MNMNQAIAEASRCLLCHDAPCSKNCPAGTDPATFIRKLRFKNIKGAIRTIKDNNILGHACGLLCPSSRLCEKGCSASGLDQPVRIGEIQAALVEHGWNCHREPRACRGAKLSRAFNEEEIKIAVIGSGPAGLACAAELAKNGHKVTVFEEKLSPGGVLRYGVPEYRLPLKFLERELDDIKALGVEIKCMMPIKGKEAIDKLFAEGYKAVFIATGLWQSIRLKKDVIPAEAGIQSSVAFLEGLRGKNAPRIKESLNGKTVAVIGGGSVAIDCAESALKFGAKEVYIIYRRSFAQMPAEEDEKVRALNSGIHFLFLNQPLDYVLDNGKLTGIKLIRTKLSFGKPENIKGSEWVFNADICIEAIGQKSDLIRSDPKTCKTASAGVFAGGDVVTGPATVVSAVAQGKLAARSIREYLGELGSQTSENTLGSQTSVWRFAGLKSGSPQLSVNFCGVKFLNPFMLSSSPVANTAEMVGRAFDAGWAGVAFKTIGAGKTKIIHPSPRMHGYHYEGKRLVGLQNVEQISDRSLKDNLKDITYLKKNWPRHVVMASIMGFSSEEWTELAIACTDAGADMLELNFSCPHMTVEGAGYKVGQAFELIERFTSDVRKATKLPIVAKMTPNITDMNEPAMFAKKGGADAISAINTLRGISEVGINDLVPRPNVGGKGAISGYSGPAVKPIGLRFIADMAKNKELNLPLSGMGGIETWVDALEYILVGATTVQVTTGIIHYGYRIIEDLIEGLTDHMNERGITNVSELIGRALPNLYETSAFDLSKQGKASYDYEKCIGCGQCYIVCKDAGGQALQWNSENRRPKLNEDKCLSCMICSFVCPVDGSITYKERDICQSK